jgi:hypothetical protein
MAAVASVAPAIRPTNVSNSKDATATIATHRIHGFWFVRGAGAINIRAGGDGGAIGATVPHHRQHPRQP